MSVAEGLKQYQKSALLAWSPNLASHLAVISKESRNVDFTDNSRIELLEFNFSEIDDKNM